jgi:hypothetical protein
MTKQKLIALLVILILLASNAFLVFNLMETQKQLSQEKIALEKAEAGKPVIKFNQLFIDKILKSQGEVSFENRLELENAARNLNDAEILNQWNRFVNAKDQTEAQTEVKGLLGLLAEKMSK